LNPAAVAATTTTATDSAGTALTAGTAANPGSAGRTAHGHVTFLGAGPGDPGLLTLRAVEALALADLLVGDRPVLDVVSAHARADVHTAEPAGEPSGSADLAPLDGAGTDSAAQLVMASARTGKRVVRAVAGDPGLDPGAAAEMLACAQAGIPFEVVPGIATEVGVPAYAGVPLSGGVRFVDAATASSRCWAETG
jgi:uroporphyrinogen III methyltransferase/synthase